MSRKWLLFLFCLCLSFLLAPRSRAGLTIKVNESTSRVWFEEQSTRVVLDIDNPLAQRISADVKLELIDTGGVVRFTAQSQEQIRPGKNSLSLPIALSLPGKAAPDSNELLWYRLRYRIAATSGSPFEPVNGLISLSEIAPDIFSLQVASPPRVAEGSSYRVRVQALHPLTSKAVAGVTLNAQIKFDGYERKDIFLRQSARTNDAGIATLDFQVPRTLEDDEGTISIEGRRGLLVATAESGVKVNRDAQVMVTTDKPIYQPGQTLHMRILMFDATRHALASEKAILKILDPENTAVFRADVETSRFGVASADWPISENTRLGDYRIEVELESDKYDGVYGAANVKISRYDLPNFTVNVKPDRAYYLPEQDARVEVLADYLFGQPVKRGHVRVVRESERHWNYRDQKWETEEGDKYEGDTDAGGKFIVEIKLGEEHAKLKDEDYLRYRDLTYAAYFTDATTNRTEQRRFDLRLTKDAIHVYIIGRDWHQGTKLPLQFYVSTSYADGTPAVCEVQLAQTWGDGEPRREHALQTIKTNQYGLAKVTALTLMKDGADDRNEPSLMFRARDAKGATGTHGETFYLNDRSSVRVETEKALYRDGDPIHAIVTTSEKDAVIAVDVVSDDRILQSQLITPRNGQATITLPYRREFTGPISIAAYLPAASGEDDEATVASRTVLYPRDRDLKFDVSFDQQTYRPGDAASANFLTRLANGRAAESALGIVIFDRAVEERARTDQEFGGHFGFYDSYCYLEGCNGSVASITRKDLDKIDLSKPLPEGMDLVAEVLLTNYQFTPRFFASEKIDCDSAGVFAGFFKVQFAPLKDRLDAEYNESCVYPTDLASLRRMSSLSAIDLDNLRDPWGTLYHTSFFAEGGSSVLEITSAGADKQFNTPDDLTVLRVGRPYFRFIGEAINRAVSRYHARTGQFVRDEATLKTELRNEGIEFDALRDPWDRPYRLEFGVNQTKFLVYARSGGPDRQFSSKDDVVLWTSAIDYARDVQAQIDSALKANLESTSQFPRNETEFQAALNRSGIHPDELRDPWGRTYYVSFKQESVYGNRVTIYNYASYGQQPKEKTELTPVTQRLNFIYLRSDGEDGKEGTADDFNVASFSTIVAEQGGNDSAPQNVSPGVVLNGSSGAITGTVTDMNGAVVAGATVVAKNKRTATEFSTTSNDEGVYLIRNVLAGSYEVRFTSAGFQPFVMTDVPVRSSSITRADAKLTVGAITSTVNITAGAVTINTTSSQLAMSVTRAEFGRTSGAVVAQSSTPRLREYFPETLVWQPSLETDKQGRAQLEFKLADNITTWKMSVIASTEDGQIGTVEKDIKAFQPFFVEHYPPRVLTEGDEISLPVVVRNYLDRAQPISLEMKPENWFSLLGPGVKHSTVPAGDAVRETFDLRATASVQDGKQRLTAIGADANDAIEKPVTVHPDGEEKSVTASDIVTGAANLTLNIADSEIPNSTRAELKIYPNLMAHVVESVEAIMERPYGCGEQTISSTYPSLLLLRNQRQAGQDSPLGARAQKYLRAGYARLLNYRDSSGGFTYWGHGDPDLALTAYALRFLSEASDLIAVDDDLIEGARAWLIKQQHADGSWAAYDYGSQNENKGRTAMLTAYIARVLAMTQKKSDANKSKPNPNALDPASSLRHALDFLAARTDALDEPYMIASYALAAIDSGDKTRADQAIAKLRLLAHDENGAAYWSLETNTPFYGWGLAGRVETTALVVQALARAQQTSETASQANESFVTRGLLFLLREQDRYGVWYSTQATINVLDAMLELLAHDVNRAVPQAVQIMVNGQIVRSVALPPPNQLVTPITIDLSQFMQRGTNRIELRRPVGSSPASAQAVATYYLPWRESVATQEANWRQNGASGLRLITRFDKTEGKISEPINCHVEAERIGFSGYGMMLAEIGLPPGAEVDRESLEKAMKGSDWSISQYDILPDRVIVYLWPRAGGSKFDFTLRPRFALKAQSAASIVYDYYNPEARAIVAPTRFVIK